MNGTSTALNEHRPNVRTALVTGANRGLGRAVAAELHRRGFEVVVSARDGAQAREAAAGLGEDVRHIQLDVTDPGSVAAAARALPEVDVLVSNAGIMLDTGADPLTVPPELVERTMAVNLIGSWRVAQAFLPAMIGRGWGRLVFVSSATGSFTAGLFIGCPAYSVSKAALNGLTQMLAAHAEGTGVLVNAVNPGQTRTRMMPSATRTAEESAVAIADAVTLPDDGPTGTFRRGDRLIGW
ncbi:SDR family NAD(P)-dependent oxidoreductase [Amycolatopsis regifaucium]|uniref:Short-chain dehydrogenase n=1 Tax=Amycolatopsis regifaucium TaxID=546365 RepID=A0A154MVL0_9PSEU|nr:SDR family NAD(P)-dependent oxidoreductase [Amycolatopsis regifaucium]KZB88312.1 short-chain dehydrogenase [Amycolatopsis regifaucium]OKA11425.1 short-chain dehydrogenase [Amycolatopsis regifaucium]SFH42142.1 Short-chain dehydrogenase [Amycolatopsis regifaucium]